MTKTIAEAHAVVDAMRRHNRVMTVGVQSMADPVWRMANEMIRRGDIGHVAQAQTSYYRNSLGGQWRYYRLTRDMNPTTIDWPMFLGTAANFSVFPGTPLAPSMPFDRALYGQWRCYWQFGGGMFTDLFVHQTTHMIAAMGVRYPGRVVGGGGIYLEYDKRDVPDVATVVADFNEGCQLIITATMINDHPIEECIRGRLATMRFVNHPAMVNGINQNQLGIDLLPQNMRSGPGVPRRLENATGRFIPGGLPVPANDRGVDTRRLWQNFLECCRTRNFDTWSTPELGAAAFTVVNMGVQSYRNAQVLSWDAANRRPVVADASWATCLEQRAISRVGRTRFRAGRAAMPAASWCRRSISAWPGRGPMGKTPHHQWWAGTEKSLDGFSAAFGLAMLLIAKTSAAFPFLQSHYFHFVWNQFQFPSSGEYAFQLWIQDRCIAERRQSLSATKEVNCETKRTILPFAQCTGKPLAEIITVWKVISGQRANLPPLKRPWRKTPNPAKVVEKRKNNAWKEHRRLAVFISLRAR